MQYSSPPLTVEKSKNLEQATSNYLYVSVPLFKKFQKATLKAGTSQEPIYVKLMGYIFILAVENSLSETNMIISGVTRSQLKISHTMDHPVIDTFKGGEGNYLASTLKLRVKAPRLQEKFEAKEKELGEEFIRKYRKHIVSQGQEIFFNYKGVDLVVTVANVETADNDDMNEFPYGMIFEETDWEIKSKSQLFRVQSKSMKSKTIFNKKFNFGDLGVGGMDEQIMVMFRRAFASRRLPAAILEQYNKNHVKGVLLFGPPGTGKTLIARQMAKCLQAKKPKIVNGK